MNWGYKLMITFIVFAGMMIYLVSRCFGTNFELVEDNYYKSELAYQTVIDGARHAGELSSLPQLTQTRSSVTVTMPKEMKNKELVGSVWFYCAYDSRKDKKINLAIGKDGSQQFSNLLTPGTYNIKITWATGTKNYYAEQKLTVL